MLRRTSALNKEKAVRKGQSAVEYMMLLAFSVTFVLIGFKTFLAQKYVYSNAYFNRIGNQIVGGLPRCGDGYCNHTIVGDKEMETHSSCPSDC